MESTGVRNERDYAGVMRFRGVGDADGKPTADRVVGCRGNYEIRVTACRSAYFTIIG